MPLVFLTVMGDYPFWLCVSELHDSYCISTSEYVFWLICASRFGGTSYCGAWVGASYTDTTFSFLSVSHTGTRISTTLSFLNVWFLFLSSHHASKPLWLSSFIWSFCFLISYAYSLCLWRSALIIISPFSYYLRLYFIGNCLTSS